jgi:hypothetical protein
MEQMMNSNTAMRDQASRDEYSQKLRPWWREPLLWLVISGPAVAVVAGVVMVWLALNGRDQLVAEDYYRQGIQINKRLEAGQRALMPAQRARNHAATPADSGAAR